MVAVFLSGCAGHGGAHDAAPESGPGGAGGAGDSGKGGAGGALSDLPALALEPLGEIALAGFTGSAEDLVVDQDGITVITLQGSAHFTLEGAADPDGINPQRAGAGADASRGHWFATVRGNVLAYYGWELMISPLEGTTSAAGLAADVDEAGSFRHLYVADSGNARIEEHTTEGGALRELAVPGAALQGLAISPGRRLFALDALQRRLVRTSADLSGLDAVARLPTVSSDPSGMHWFESRLHVCFRDSNRIAVFRLDESN